MLEGFYTIASGMMTQQKKLNLIGNNLVNSQTPGYRSERIVTSAFENQLMTRKEAYASGSIGTSAPITLVEEVSTLFDSGSLKGTERGLDLALNGEGYFNIQTSDQANSAAVLTRNGQFDIDAEGYLVLPGVGRVIGDNGPLQLKDSNFVVKSDGTITDQNDKKLGKLVVTAPAEKTILEKLGNGMYRAENNGQMEAPENMEVLQNCLEVSNVDYNQEYTKLMEAQRAFQSCSTALQIADEINQKSAAQIASL